MKELIEIAFSGFWQFIGVLILLPLPLPFATITEVTKIIFKSRKK